MPKSQSDPGLFNRSESLFLLMWNLVFGAQNPNKMPKSAEKDKVCLIEYLFLISNKTSNEMPLDCKQQDMCRYCQCTKEQKVGKVHKTCFVSVFFLSLSQNNNYDNASTNHIK